jgi:hypothetical protein
LLNFDSVSISIKPKWVILLFEASYHEKIAKNAWRNWPQFIKEQNIVIKQRISCLQRIRWEININWTKKNV